MTSRRLTAYAAERKEAELADDEAGPSPRNADDGRERDEAGQPPRQPHDEPAADEPDEVADGLHGVVLRAGISAPIEAGMPATRSNACGESSHRGRMSRVLSEKSGMDAAYDLDRCS